MRQSDCSTFLNQLFSFEGKVAVVIGGTGVLCGAMAGGLWRAGCRVVLIGRNPKKAEAHFQVWGSPPDEMVLRVRKNTDRQTHKHWSRSDRC